MARERRHSLSQPRPTRLSAMDVAAAENAAAAPPVAPGKAGAATPARRALGDLTNVARAGATPAPAKALPPRPALTGAGGLPRAASARAARMPTAARYDDAPEAAAGRTLAEQDVMAEAVSATAVAAAVAALRAGAARYGGLPPPGPPPAFAVLDDGLMDRPDSEEEEERAAAPAGGAWRSESVGRGRGTARRQSSPLHPFSLQTGGSTTPSPTMAPPRRPAWTPPSRPRPPPAPTAGRRPRGRCPRLPRERRQGGP